MAISNVVKIIRAQMMGTGALKVGSWGAHAWAQIDQMTLQFKVNGRHFQGHVRIAYDEDYDQYVICFGRWRNRQWQNIETINNVNFDQMVDLIDQKVEYIKAYTK